MKPFVIIGVAVVFIVLLAMKSQGASHNSTTSEELEKIIEQLQEVVRSQYRPKQPNSHAQWSQWGKQPNSHAQWSQWGKQPNSHAQWSQWGKQPNSHAQWSQWGAATANSAYHPFEVSTQVQGVNIQNCGSAGDIISAALSSLNIFSNWFGVLVDCQEQGGSKCGGTGTRIRVDVPANTRKTDVRVCNRNGQPCVEVLAQSSQNCLGFPIPITVPIRGGQQITVQVNIGIFTIPQCASVKVNAPACS